MLITTNKNKYFLFFGVGLVLFVIFFFISMAFVWNNSDPGIFYFVGIMGIVSCVRASRLANISKNLVLPAEIVASLMTLFTLALFIETIGRYYEKYVKPITKISYDDLGSFIGFLLALTLSIFVAKKLLDRRRLGIIKVEEHPTNKVFFWIAIASTVFCAAGVIAYLLEFLRFT